MSTVMDPPQTEHDETPEVPGGVDQELVIDAGGQISFDVGGGKEPTSSTLNLTGGKFKVDGQLKKGEGLSVSIARADGTVLFEGAAIVDVVAFKDEHDAKTGQVVGCQRQHKARISAA